jgi:hypothetical protein
MAAPSPVSASLSWMPCRIALLLREQLAKAFSALLQPTRRCWLETYLTVQAFACTKELIE